MYFEQKLKHKAMKQCQDRQGMLRKIAALLRLQEEEHHGNISVQKWPQVCT